MARLALDEQRARSDVRDLAGRLFRSSQANTYPRRSRACDCDCWRRLEPGWRPCPGRVHESADSRLSDASSSLAGCTRLGRLDLLMGIRLAPGLAKDQK